MASYKRQFFLSLDQLFIEPDKHYGEVYESKIADYVLHPTKIFRFPLEVYRQPSGAYPNGINFVGASPFVEDWRYGQWVLKNGRHRALAAITLGHRWLWCEEVEAPDDTRRAVAGRAGDGG